ncbi:MAG: hypothetical protein PHH59_09105 [Methylovulum sp.]|uniref:COG4648 family protein n=1 Tax=Methylovulum sp. TaxID=1916980 RepID=UPI0026191B15|nr:hypothetical protein [Methylovulum sp.]MDD2724161.1 hypothetical protein [Methylovulum sp.]MDD5123193.1 hypothetical protein [Methylovulum sp.]
MQQKAFGILKGFAFASLFITYPYLVYRGMESGMNWLAPLVFSGIFLYRAWLAQEFRRRVLNLVFAIALLLGAYYVQTLTAKILPVLVQLTLMVFFGRGLFGDKELTFIERVVRLQFPESPPAVSIYCRQLSLIWTVFFAGNALVCTLLAIYGTGYGWAFYNGVLIYVLMGVLGIGEYIYRRIHFADLSVLHQGIPDPMTTIKALFINGRKVFLEMKER